MSQINSNTKDDFQAVLLLSCFVGHPVGISLKCCVESRKPEVYASVLSELECLCITRFS